MAFGSPERDKVKMCFPVRSRNSLLEGKDDCNDRFNYRFEPYQAFVTLLELWLKREYPDGKIKHCGEIQRSASFVNLDDLTII